MEPRLHTTAGEVRLAAKYTGVCLAGFAVDFAVLHLAMAAGLEPAWARVVSLALAMHVTFLINGLHVFGVLTPGREAVRQWAAYMATNGFGNLCNYWIFVTLVSLHWRIVSAPWLAICVGSSCAWAINYLCTRFVVFGLTARWAAAGVRRARRRSGPSPAAPRSAPR